VTVTASVFDLPDRLAAKRDPALIAHDQEHFAAIAASLRTSVQTTSDRLAALRRTDGRWGQAALERDLEIHRLSARLRTLQRYGADLCLGRMVVAGEPEPVYIGRTGLTADDGTRLLTDWRSPAAEPFFAATLADPRGLVSRRRYRWSGDRITDYWDEVFDPETAAGDAALDDQSAFIASLAARRSPRMRDVLATLQADQDAIIRAGSRGALVVDGGPGTGKTVVALHRAAYLLYTDPRLSRSADGRHRGGVLFVGPSNGYLAYVSDVLPSLGEDGVQLCTLRDLLPEGAAAEPEADPAVARIKADRRMVQAVEAAVRGYEHPPTATLIVETEWADIAVDAAVWADAFASAEAGAPHNETRDQVWEELVGILVERHDELPGAVLRRAVEQDAGLRAAFAQAWPLLDPDGVVADLWSEPASLRRCAPWLAEHERALLHRDEPRRWTVSDLPLLDEARRRIGDPSASRRRRERAATLAAERERMDRVIDDLIAADDGEGLVTMLRGEDVRTSLDDESVLPVADPDVLAGPFAHIVVDEAQELTDAEWQMLLGRCPSRSFTIVGDRAQARHGFTESWQERLGRVGLRDVRFSTLTINYRTPEEIMAEAEPVIRAVLPDANVPVSIRSSGVPVRHAGLGERDAVLDAWAAEDADGVACVIGDPAFRARPRIRSLMPELAKGLEFDLVVLVEPEAFGTGIECAVDRYVAMTRATRELVVLSR
jgi:DNA helicase IV